MNMNYAIDGNNALLGLRINNTPSVRLFSKLLLTLKSRGDDFQLFFDNSIGRHMKKDGVQDEWEKFLAALPMEGIKPPIFAPRADTLIEYYCESHNAGVINSRDKMDSWTRRPSVIHRVRAYRNRNVLQISLKDDANGRFLFSSTAHEKFTFGNIDFPQLDTTQINTERPIHPNEDSDAVSEGVLLILALDASWSMTENKSFDGRTKSEHLNDIVKQTVLRLKSSVVSRGLYMAILRFENDVTTMLCPTTDTKFASIYEWEKCMSNFDYLTGLTPGQTNIRLALQRSKELLQDTLEDDDSLSELADDWRATVILVTDGNHFVQRQDGSAENDNDVAGAVLDIHGGLEGIRDQKIVVGCVGIGTDVNSGMLSDIASQCSTDQRKMAKNAGIENLLLDGRLFIKVDSNNNNFGNAIRTFIDVASSST